MVTTVEPVLDPAAVWDRSTAASVGVVDDPPLTTTLLTDETLVVPNVMAEESVAVGVVDAVGVVLVMLSVPLVAMTLFRALAKAV
ncbi:hypothetical protein [Nitrospirillum sp. BR 11828]|uniref:hypothetical protein n=1 Tax=Nitrospirillum sp. BR 11828 TaxID=3104325 RepID=UPI002ACA5B50|nr:hypothetical protein [Nitrospirillum sp. BR 11828]MDZ5650667.1 hypothetical protein [Nitrospirillum sp. BR 11828]